MSKTVIIGGVAGGASCAARLRRLDGEREIIILHSIGGFKHKEIASFLNMPIGTVLSKYKRVNVYRRA